MAICMEPVINDIIQQVKPPTNVKYVDRDQPLLIGANGFPVRNTNQLVLGNAQPKWIGGIRNTFSYKGISLSFPD